MPPKRKRIGRSRRPRNKVVFNKIVVQLEIDSINGQVKKEQVSPDKYTCSFCKKSFKDANRLERHKKLCKKKFKQLIAVDLVKKHTFSCQECNKKFKFKKSFASHLLNEHSKLPDAAPCPQCPVVCPNKDILKRHVTEIHEREIFQCLHCSKEFVRQSHVLRHMSQKGCDGQGVSIYPCEICNAQFSRKDNLMVHLRLQHIIQKKFTCKHCAYSTQTFSKLLIHVQKFHTDAPMQYECDHCGKTTSSRAAISKHLEIHGTKKYSCDVCGYKTFTIEVMRRHVLTHVKEKPYKCNRCAQSFIQRVQLQRHMEKHDGHHCTLCDKTFTIKSRLFMHMRTHTNKGKLLCPFEDCEWFKKEMDDLEQLNAHIKEHLPEKSFSCEVCAKRFSSEVNMRRHVSSHKLERPRRCMYCVAARAYVRGMQLVRHVRKAHPAVFRDHLAHVRSVLGHDLLVERVKKSELESILNVLDAEADRIIQGYGEGVLYGGMQEVEARDAEPDQVISVKAENNPLMTEEELADNLNRLLSQLVDLETLECFGWPDESVDTVLERVIEHCGARPADRDKWTRVQCLRENAKHLFLYIVEDKNIARMLHTHTIDQIVKHILAQVTNQDVVVIDTVT